jgi:hypothetical protein
MPRFRILGIVVVALVLVSCAGPVSGPPGTELSPWDTLAVGGDTMIARWEHDLVTRNGHAWPLEELAP